MASSLRHRNLPHLMLQSREALMAFFRPVLNRHGITEQQWRVLRALIDAGPLEPRQLGERCQISSPSLTGVLLRMEDAGLLARERMDHDQRRLKVSLAKAGRQLGARIAPEIEQRYAEIEQRVGVVPLHQVYDVLDTLLQHLATDASADARADGHA